MNVGAFPISPTDMKTDAVGIVCRISSDIWRIRGACSAVGAGIDLPFVEFEGTLSGPRLQLREVATLGGGRLQGLFNGQVGRVRLGVRGRFDLHHDGAVRVAAARHSSHALECAAAVRAAGQPAAHMGAETRPVSNDRTNPVAAGV